MIVGVRRALAGLAVGLVVSLGVGPMIPAFADTATPTPVAATATPSASTGTDVGADIDVAPDNSRQAWALGGAGAVALLAAAIVFLRRR
jgi:hypothetical protein